LEEYPLIDKPWFINPGWTVPNNPTVISNHRSAPQISSHGPAELPISPENRLNSKGFHGFNGIVATILWISWDLHGYFMIFYPVVFCFFEETVLHQSKPQLFANPTITHLINRKPANLF